MAKGLVTGRRWVYSGRDRSSVTAAMWLLGTTFTKAAAEAVGAIVGDVSTSVMSLNGQPMTTSGWIVHKADWVKVVDKVKTIEEAME